MTHIRANKAHQQSCTSVAALFKAQKTHTNIKESFPEVRFGVLLAGSGRGATSSDRFPIGLGRLVDDPGSHGNRFM